MTAPDAVTRDQIMALAIEYAASFKAGTQYVDENRAALRAAIERVIADYGAAMDTLAHLRQTEERAERAEAEVARLRQEIGQPLQAERERDALRALLVEAQYALGECEHPNAKETSTDDCPVCALEKRIDAAMKDQP